MIPSCYLLVRDFYAAAQHEDHLLFCDGSLLCCRCNSIPTIVSSPLLAPRDAVFSGDALIADVNLEVASSHDVGLVLVSDGFGRGLEAQVSFF